MASHCFESDEASGAIHRPDRPLYMDVGPQLRAQRGQSATVADDDLAGEWLEGRRVNAASNSTPGISEMLGRAAGQPWDQCTRVRVPPAVNSTFDDSDLLSLRGGLQEAFSCGLEIVAFDPNRNDYLLLPILRGPAEK
jgi:hypothetical protein